MMDTENHARHVAADLYGGSARSSLEALPEYLVRHYRWAYLWPISVWFFDHQPIINTILFGNYRAIMDNTLHLMRPETAGRTLQIAAVYGKLTPTLAKMIDDFSLVDAAAIQLHVVARKLLAIGRSAKLARMNAESLAYASDSFDTSLMFLLLHEMPSAARRRSLTEVVRVTRRGGRLVIAEYGENRNRHFFHRFAPLCWTLVHAEPFLADFWHENLTEILDECAAATGKRIEVEDQVNVADGFYRVVSYLIK